MPVEVLYSVIGFLSVCILGLIASIWKSESGDKKQIFATLDEIRKIIGALEHDIRNDLTMLDRRLLKLEEWRKANP